MINPLFINNNNLLNKNRKKSNKTKKSKKLKKRPDICSPHLNTSKTNHSCFNLQTLKKIVSAWNTSNPENKIKIKKSDKHNDIWNKLGDKMSGKCGNEYCWTKQPFFKNHLKKKN